MYSCRKYNICTIFFFFSSRRRHTRLQGDWSSDVCSSDLTLQVSLERLRHIAAKTVGPIVGSDHGRVAVARELGNRVKRLEQIGRASCRERGEISVVAVSLKKKKKIEFVIER